MVRGGGHRLQVPLEGHTNRPKCIRTQGLWGQESMHLERKRELWR